MVVPENELAAVLTGRGAAIDRRGCRRLRPCLQSWTARPGSCPATGRASGVRRDRLVLIAAQGGVAPPDSSENASENPGRCAGRPDPGRRRRAPGAVSLFATEQVARRRYGRVPAGGRLAGASPASWASGWWGCYAWRRRVESVDDDDGEPGGAVRRLCSVGDRPGAAHAGGHRRAQPPGRPRAGAGTSSRRAQPNDWRKKRTAYAADLMAANDELARAARMKDEFLAAMSHELRTPLNTILGMTEVLLDQVFGALNERQLRSLRHVAESGKHLLELINDILDVAKVESGQMQLHVDIVDLPALCTWKPGADPTRGREQADLVGHGVGPGRQPPLCRRPARAADSGQPAEQCRQVHPGRRPNRSVRNRGPSECGGESRRLGHRHRDRRRGSAAPLQTLRADRQQPESALRRHRSWV